jgi:MFS family permease
MRRYLSIIAGDPVLRMLCWVTLMFGCHVATIGPFQSLIAVETLGLSEAAYALILFGGMVTAVTVSVGIGIITDQRPSRRFMAILASLSVVASAVIVFAGQNAIAFAIGHALLLPVSGTLFGQIFAVCRLCTAAMPQHDRDAVLAIIRSLFALPWLVVLPAWGWAFDAGLSLLSVYPGMGLFGLIGLVIILRRWPADRNAPWQEVKSGLKFRNALAEMLGPGILARVQLVGILQAGGAMSGILVGLTFAEAGRDTGDVSLFFAAFVGVEVLGSVMVGWFLRFGSRAKLIACGVGLYAAYLIALPVLAPTPWVWALVVPAGLGGGLIYPLVIAYLADLLGTRAGAGASLLSLGRIGQDGISAGSFWLGTALAGYGLAAVLGAAGSLIALVLMTWLDRRRP